MTIIVNSISPRHGGIGGSDYNDFNDIITNTFGGSINIKSIDINNVQVAAGSYIDSVQFTYNVMTNDGKSNVYAGIKRGGTGGTNENFILADNERIVGISGKYGTFGKEPYDYTYITYLEFKTSQTTHIFGTASSGETAFTLPAGIIFGSAGMYLDSLGTIQISVEPPVTVTEVVKQPPVIVTEVVKQPPVTVTEAVKQPPVTVTEAVKQPPVTETAAVTETVKGTCPSGIPATLDQKNDIISPINTPAFVCLSFTTAILGLYFLITMGIFLWKKFHSPKPIPNSGRP